MSGDKRRLKIRETDAFDLGWDHGIYGIAPDPRLPSPVRQGYLAARQERDPQTADRFAGKWLQIRTNAMLRGILFDASITPETLKSLDVKRCPVSGVVLTHGERADSDWSVDRVLNDRGYRPGNLLVLSSRVNAAKGSRRPGHIRKLANSGDAHAGLAASEWKKLSEIVDMFEVAEKGDPPAGLPLLTGAAIVSGLRLSPVAFWQFALTLALRDDDRDLIADVVATLPRTKNVRRAILLLSRELQLRFRKSPEPFSAWRSKRVQKRLMSLLEALPHSWSEAQARCSEQYFSSHLGLAADRQRLRSVRATVWPS